MNPFWGLSYPWIMGLFFHVVGPSAQQEVLAVRLTNLLMVLFAVAAFDVFIAALLQWLRSRQLKTTAMFSDRQLLVIGYAIFLWSVFCVNWPALISPDLLVCAVFLTAVGLLLRICTDRKPILPSVLFGLTLAAGYYTKALYVPLGLLLVACLTVCLWQRRSLWPALPLTLLVIMVGCAPYYGAIARHTRGVPNAASLNYAWHVNDLWYFIHWHGEGEGMGTPIHSTQQITHGLRAYAFAEPIHATYAPWYDPSYFYAGFKTGGFHADRQAAALKFNVAAFSHEMGTKPLVWTEFFCILGLLVYNGRPARSGRESLKVLLSLWVVLVPSAAALLLFFAVHIEIRYIQGMMCCLVLLPVVCLRTSPAATSGRSLTWVTRAATVAIAAVVALSIAVRTHHKVDRVSFTNPLKQDRYWLVAKHIRDANFGPQPYVAEIGEGMDCLWAFLAHARIVAEVPHDYDNAAHLGDGDRYWTASTAEQQEVLSAFRNAGAQFVIAVPAVDAHPGEGWVPIENTGYYFHALGTSTAEKDFTIHSTGGSPAADAPMHPSR